MVQEKEVTLRPNGNGAQIFFGPQLIEDSSCSFDNGDEIVAVAVEDNDVMILKSASDPNDYSVVPDPEQATLDNLCNDE